MKKNRILSWAAGMVLCVGPLSAQVIIPVTSGPATEEGYYPFEAATDYNSSIVTIPTDLQTVAGGSLGNTISSFTSRAGYIDFGASFASITITSVFTAYRSFDSYDGTKPFASLWWSSDKSKIFGGDDTLVTQFNFGTSSKPYDDSNVVWRQDFSGLNVTLAGRYLILLEDGTNPFANGRATELLFVGSTTPVPEPSTIALLGVGLGASWLGYRRRARA